MCIVGRMQCSFEAVGAVVGPFDANSIRHAPEKQVKPNAAPFVKLLKRKTTLELK